MLHHTTLLPLKLCILFVVLVTITVCLGIPSLAAERALPTAPSATIIDSNITTDTTWTLANSPYHIQNNIDVDPGVTLTIEPGVEIWIDAKMYFHVREGGSLIAKGTPTQHITIDRYIDPATNTGSRWRKIWFHENTSSYFRHVRFAYGGSAANGDDTILHFEGAGTHVLNKCEILASKQQGVVAQGEGLNLTIAGSLFRDNGRWSVLADSGANVTITGSTFDVQDFIAIRLRTRDVPAIVTVSGSNILSTGAVQTVWNEMAGSVCLNAQGNWWGASSGPYDGSATGDACGLTSHGGAGALVTDGVDYHNWLTAEASRAGITTVPTASFTVTPDPTVVQPPGTIYTFDASGSTDAEDYTSSLEFCWDWDNNGACDTAYSHTQSTTHSFSGASGPTQTVRLVVRDTDGDTDEATQVVQLNQPPTPVLTSTLLAWNQVSFDATGSSDAEDDAADLQVAWDFQGDEVLDTAYSFTKTITHTYAYLGRYWPTVYVKDTDDGIGTLSQPVDVIPPMTSTLIISPTGALTSVDGTVQVEVTSDAAGTLLIGGLTITHTPWLTLPYDGLQGSFLYQGFNLSAWSVADGQPVDQVSGPYTITLSYDENYVANVLGLLFEKQIQLHRWGGSSWSPVTATLDTDNDRLVATTNFFGDFALTMDVKFLYLPLVVKAD